MLTPIRSEITLNPNLAVNYMKDYNLADSSHPIAWASIQAIYTDTTASPVVVPSTDITFATCLFHKINHGLSTGEVGQFTTSVALPSGIVVLTDYWIIVIDPDNFKVADSLTHAESGTAITLTDSGTGNQTFTSTALATVVVKLQMSNDGINFTDITGKTVTINATGSILWDLLQTTYRILRVVHTPNAGAINLTLNFNGLNWI